MTTTAIAAVVPRFPVQLEGDVVTIEAHAAPPIFLDVVLSDGSGSITLLFQGRKEIPGIHEGSRLRATGTPLQAGELLFMLNPRYELRDPPTVG